MRSYLLDGPVQKQMILLKLMHAMNNRPKFGDTFDNNPDGAVRRWISQVKALMDRVSVSKSVQFAAALGTAATYWKPAMQSLQIAVNDAIEELKLELELYQDDQIGVVYGADESHKFKKDLLAILGNASLEVFAIDPYLDANIFALLFENHATFDIRVLCQRYFEGVDKYASSFAKQYARQVLVKKSQAIHDRVIFVDEDCWIMGASLKDAGVKPTYLMPIPPLLGAEKKKIYDAYWATA